ncbi:hypothetical protein [Massilia sp. X63]|uniref:hypothetical protein n=1 Tax=Massilia sp. X63 TaxID=3237285 RepID=UPI0034DD15DB
MQATLYISADAMATINAIKDLDYYDRVSLSDAQETDLTTAPGYFLNTNALQLAELPADADVALHLTPSAAATYDRHVNIPAHLRGVIFSNAPDLPPQYSEIIGYWSPLHLTNHHRYAWAYQNVLNSYCVSLTDIDSDVEVHSDDEPKTDRLLNDGLVVTVTGLAALLAVFSPEQFIAVDVPINPTMIGLELEGYRSAVAYCSTPTPQMETLYLQIADILASPDADLVAISAIRTELSDYGYTY